MYALEKPLELRDFLEQNQCVFSFDGDCNEQLSDWTNNFNDDESDKGGDGIVVRPADLISPWTKPFAELIPTMEKVDTDLYKKIQVAGDKTKGTVPDKARVSIRYSFFWEGDRTPYDSSYLRGQTFEFYVGVTEVLPGFKKAVQSMLVGEISQFVVGYNLLYGERGFPPRIKPRADSLMIIELLAFTNVGNLNAYQELKEDEKKDFACVLKSAQDIKLKGMDFFKLCMYEQAKLAFIRALDLIVAFPLTATDINEKMQQNEFLINSYTNLAVCCNKLCLPHETCKMVKEVKRLAGNDKPSAKILYHEGIALMATGEYDDARNALTSAAKLDPFNESINHKLFELNEKQGKFKVDEKKFWRKAFENTLSYSKDDKKKQIKVDQLKYFFEKFKKSEVNRLCVSSEFLADDINLSEQLAESFQIKLYIDSDDSSKCVLEKTKD